MIIRDLPLVWRLNDAPDAPRPTGVPSRLDFEWDWDARLGLLRQRPSVNLKVALEAIYRAGSENLGATPAYGAAFWSYLTPCLRKSMRVLDIGAGDGKLLKRIYSEIGPGDEHALIGLEPSLSARDGVDPAYPLGPLLLRGHFPDERLAGQRFDLIVNHYVLEHLPDPVAFLSECRDLLAAGGMIVCAVPDCTESIAIGDIGMATGQHLNYFTKPSLERTFWTAGLYGIAKRDYAGGGLFIDAVRAPSSVSCGHLAEKDSFGRFYARAVKARANIAMIVDAIVSAGWPIHYFGVYCPMRILPYLPSWIVDRLRLFDDGMRGKYLDGVAQRIEGIEDFEAKPVDTMIVASLTHERAIVDKLAGRCKVITLREMLDV